MSSHYKFHWYLKKMVFSSIEKAKCAGLGRHAGGKIGLYLRRTAILLRWRGQRERLGVGGRRLHTVVIVVSEAAEERAENAPAPVLL